MGRILTKVLLRALHRKPDQSRWRDLNPRQADYKSATLPAELQRLLGIFQHVKELFDYLSFLHPAGYYVSIQKHK